MTEPRKPLTKKQRAELYLEQKGRCYVCGEFRTLAEFDDDHRLPLELGGTNDLSNRKLICRATCHREKTIAEAKARGKVRRLRKKSGLDPAPEKRKRAWPSRPLANARFKRNFDGTVSRRNA